jgi:serine/threonine-protein kinase RsbW
MEIHGTEAPVSGETIFACTVPGDLATLTPLTIRLVNTLRESGCIGDDENQRFEVCFEEAVKNAIVHGCGNHPDRSITARLFRDGDQWGAVITDEGNGFTLEDIPNPDDPDFPWREEGRGIHLMAHCIDQVAYYDGGRTVVLRHAIGERTSPEEAASETAGAEPLRLSRTDDYVLATVSLKGADEAVVGSVFEALLSAVRAAEGRLVILDLSGVSFLPSHAIGRIIRVYKTCVAVGSPFAVTGVSEELGKVFSAMRLDTIFSIYGSPEEAVRAGAPA